MKLRYKNLARIELESFINHFKEGFRVLYSGTGLWNEDLIIAAMSRVQKGFMTTCWLRVKLGVCAGTPCHRRRSFSSSLEYFPCAAREFILDLKRRVSCVFFVSLLRAHSASTGFWIARE